MRLFIGLDVSLAKTAICVVSEHGKIVKEAQVASEPEALASWIAEQNGSIAAIGLEAGPLSQWLHRVTWFSDGVLLGIPNPIFIFLLVTAVVAFVSAFSTFGRHLYAIGGNREAARLSGLPVARDLLVTYSISGFLAGLAGLLTAAQLLQGSSLVGRGYELDAIAAVMVGGASLAGGNGNPFGTVIGVFVLATIVNIMNLVGISSEPQFVIKGAVIVVAVFLSSAGGVARISAFFSKFRGRRS